MRICDPSVARRDPLSTGRTSLVPFLPTLVTAFAIGGLSLLCREPAAQPPIAPAPSMTMAVVPVSAPTRDAREWPVSLLLAQLPPPVMTEPAPASVRVANRRSCAAGRCETRRALAARSAPATTPARPSPEPVLARRDAPEPERAGTLPDDALPFISAADRVWDAARTLGGRVTTIGSSVSDVLPNLY